ncbi:LuxR C-terminal-related transcriptional regulator [Bradyrhizobium sp. CCBAU 53340]|uniref:LuxR C-terminal-related transcriptional regulator n=1 Tax=Bradyrhizobium sp. CCBAU 53340 TaxID=1325112 RepID=UPI00188C8D76|nr:LuxR C-terminal-related transcriptional regulator [Bradyrhizobium sp. CCBAU 53340]
MPKDIDGRAEAQFMLDVTAKQWIFQRIRLLIVDRQPIVLQGLKSVLGAQQDFDVVGSSCDGASCLEAIRKLTPDVALVADTLPDLTVSEILAIAKAENLSTRLVFFAESDTNDDLTAAVAAGECSAISKYASPETMLRSLRLMAKRGVSLEQSDLSSTGENADGGKIEKLLEQLTQRERQIVRLVSEGMSNKEIARQLNVSQGTVKVHLYNIFQKLEITNRTVLATIALLQRTSVFGTLALAFLAFAIADELKAAEANETLPNGMPPNDDNVGHVAEHGEYEPWKKAILRHRVAWESSETPPHTLRDFFAKLGQVASPAAAMDALRAAEESASANLWKGYVGSSTLNLLALLPRGTGDTQAGSDPAPEHQIPRPTFNPMSFAGGLGTFASLAGALIYALQDPHLAAQAHEASNVSIDSPLGPTGEHAATKVATITDADAHHAHNAAQAFLSQESQQPSALATTDSVASGNLHHVGLTDPGHDAGLGAYDQLIGGNVVQRSPIDSGSTSSSSAFDFGSGSGRVNLAAFGALAWLHMTATSKSIPPHTVAWIYNAATNETIVYVNSTDHSLDIGDHGLLEVHLQGMVSVAESDLVSQPEVAAVAITLEQLEQALPSATVTDETVQSADNVHATVAASESTSGTSGSWSVLADDASKFQVGQTSAGSGGSKSSGGSSTDAADTEESDGASDVPAQPVGLAHGAKLAAVEAHALKSEPIDADTGVSPTAQNEIVQPSVAPATEAVNSAPGDSSEHRAAASEADGMDRGNSGHGKSANAEEAADSVASDGATADSASQGNSQHESEPGSAKAAEAQDKEHGNSAHSNSASAAQAAENVAPDAAPVDSASHGNSQHASEPGSAKAAEAQDKEQGNSAHSNSVSAAQAAESVAPDAGPVVSASHGNSQHASEPGSAKAAATELVEVGPGNGSGNGHPDPASDAAAAPAGVAAADQGEHGNSGHRAQSTSTNTPEAGLVGPSDATGGNAGGNSQHAAEPGPAKAATELAEADLAPGNGVGNDNGHPDPAPHAADVSASATSDRGEHGNSGHDAQSTSANPPEAGLVEPNNATDGNAGGNSQHAAEPGSAKAATELAEADPTPANGGGNDNGHPDPASDAAAASAGVTAADQGDHGTSGHDAQSTSTNTPEAGLVGPSDTTGGNAGGNSQDAVEPGPAKATATELAEADLAPGNGVGNDNGHPDPASDAAAASAGVTAADQGDHGNSGHDAQSTPANTPDAGLVEPNNATGGSAGGNSQDAAEPGPTKTTATELAEADPTPANGVGNDNGHPDPASHAADASTVVATADQAGPGDAQHAVQSPATAEEAAQPANAAPEAIAADQGLVFRFDSVATPPAVVAVVGPEQLNDLVDSHVPPGQVEVLGMIVNTVSDVPDAHAANHGNSAAPHHLIVSATHDLLI